jgi:hypothetical protein
MNKRIDQINEEIAKLQEERKQLKIGDIDKYKKDIDWCKKELDSIILDGEGNYKGEETITLKIQYRALIDTEELGCGVPPNINRIVIDKVIDKTQPKNIMSRLIRNWILHAEASHYTMDEFLTQKDKNKIVGPLVKRLKMVEKRMKKLPEHVENHIWDEY